MRSCRESNALRIVSPHCDIEERLRSVPPSTQSRGIWFQAIESAVHEYGRMEAFRDFFPNERWSALSYYPLSIYLLRLAVAGALIASPKDVHGGMREVMRKNSTRFASSLLGKALLRVLSRDPIRLTEQAMAARRQTTNYGEWAIVSRGPHHIETHYRSEYLWIESAVTGAAIGTFEACDIRATVETRLEDSYNGVTRITW